MRAAIADLLRTVFKIRPEEQARVLLAVVYLFTCVGAFIIGRITRSVLFLEIPGYKEQLPLLYMVIAGTVSLAMAAYARVERRLRRDYTNAITLGIIIAITLAFRFALARGGHAGYWAFYVWVELLGSFVIVQFWALANEIFHSRQAKRLFAVIGGGGVLANVVVGFAISGSVKALGTENLLFLMAALLAAGLAAALRLGHAARSELGVARGRGPAARAQRGGRIFASRHVRLIAAVVVVVYVVSTFVDYQFQVIVGESIPGKDDRSAFFGAFFGVTGLLAALIQFFFTARILERFGVLLALALLPVAMLAGSVALLLAPLIPSLWAVAATKGAENALRYTISDSTLQLFYLPLPAPIRSRVKTVIDGILKPIAIGGAGLAMVVLVGQLDRVTGIELGVGLEAADLSWLIVVALGGWLAALVQLRKEYVSSLLGSLQRRRLSFAESRLEIGDEATVRALESALTSTDETRVLHALELTRFVTPRARAGLSARITGLLRHPADEVRVAALSALVQSAALAEDVVELLADRSPAVRSAATLAYCALAGQHALGRVQLLLEDVAAEVRGAAVAGLIRNGGLDGVLACADTLKRMLSSPQAAERRVAAWVLGEVGVQTFFQPLVPLLDDPDERVRHAAIVAAGSLRTTELTGALVRKLGDPRLAGAAAAALAAYGPSIVETVTGLLSDPDRDARTRAHACRVLARVADLPSVELLHAHLADPDATVRGAAIASLTLLAHHRPGLRVDRGVIAAAVQAEARHAFELLAVTEDLAVDDHALLLRDALTHRWAQVHGRIYGLLALVYPAETIELVTRNLRASAPGARANAVEALDNLLVGEEKALIIPLLDDAPPARKLAQVQPLVRIERHGREGRLRALLVGPDRWLQVCAAAAAAAWGIRELEPEVRALLSSDAALCRETAMVALRRLAGAGALRPWLDALKQDPAPSVRRYAAHVFAEIA